MALLASSIGLISCLKRRDEATVPNFPVESTPTAVTVAGSMVGPVDVADKAAVVHVRTHDVLADDDNVIRRGDVAAGSLAQADVVAAGGVG